MTDPAAIIDPLRRILGAGVGIAVTDPTDPKGHLLPEEKDAVSRAITARRLEFTAGRVAAREALTQIGHPAVAIPSAPDRSPIWPEGIVGSITHCADLCVAISARRQKLQCLGIDIEPQAPLPAEMFDVICTSAERAWLEAHPASQHGALGQRLFCAKESAYKAIFPLTGAVIEFTDMQVTFSPDLTHFTTQTKKAPNITGHVLRLPGHVVALSTARVRPAQSCPKP